MSRTLVLLDGNSLLFRGFFAMRALTTSDGQPTNALFALTNMLVTLLEQFPPALAYCAWDTHEPTFRHTAYDAYKGTRDETPADLIAQGPLARQLTDAFRVPALEAPGWEADDILGTLATQGAERGFEVLIVTGDLDALQLVGPQVRVLTTVKGVTDTVLYDEAKVFERYGLRPDQLADYRALKGDTSDNIPGVPGIGEKTAVALLQQFGTVETLEARLDEVAPARAQAAIRANLALMRLSKELAVISREVPLPSVVLPAPDACPPYAPDLAAIKPLFERLEFRTLLRRAERFGAAQAAGARVAEEPAAPLVREVAAQALAVTEAIGAQALADALAQARTVPAVGVRLWLGEGGALDAPLLGIALGLGAGRVVWAPLAEAAPSGLGGLFDAPLATAPAAPAAPAVVPEALRALLGDAGVAKITHDARTTLTVLERYGAPLRGLAFDTELAAYLDGAGRKTGFPLHEIAGDLAGLRIPEPLDKKARAALSDDERNAREVETVQREADALVALRETLAPRLAGDGLDKVLTEIELPVAPILAAMERVGVAVDGPELSRLSVELGAKAAALEAQIHALAGEPFLINSPKQLSAVLFERLKLPAGKKTTTGYSTDAETLELLAEDHEIVALVLQYRELTKLKGTYTDAMPSLVRPDGRIHTSLHQTVAATGRLSSSNPNLQNIPIRTAVGREIRRAFVAPPGGVLLSADYSQIELRLFAHMSEDAELCAAFDAGEDIHRYTASRVFGVAPAEVTTDQRRAAKTVNFAVLYGISDFALGRQLKIAQSEAKALKQSYFARFPGVKSYLDETIAFAREKGYVTTLLGRRRWIPDIGARVFSFRQAAERAAANMPIQGSSADIMKIAMVRVWEWLERERPQARLLLQVHDELLFECPEGEAATVGAAVRACMEGAYPLRIRLEVEVKTGRTWADVTPVA